MDVVNKTAVPFSAFVAKTVDGSAKRGIFTAKATFRLEGGKAIVDRDDPFPLTSEVTKHGDWFHLPPDESHACIDGFDVSVVAIVRAPRPTPRRLIRLRIGDVKRELEVVGDRTWTGDSDGFRTTSDPEPFIEMPISWKKAFGGLFKLEVGPGAFMSWPDPFNPLGTGAIPDGLTQIGDYYELPPGYPKEIVGPTAVPNIQAPGQRYPLQPAEPLVTCWAPCPASATVRLGDAMNPETVRFDDPLGEYLQQQADAVVRYAHPELQLERPPEGGEPIELIGIDGDDSKLSFTFPRLRVRADCRTVGGMADVGLRPQFVVVFVDEQRLVVTYRAAVQFRSGLDDRSSVRVRLAGGGE
ncbi:DUF2169 domain-containing protein [Desulfobulbus sp. AH-315-M07]|nr:DUF2169 domain-containing protein [Desulfobulbus sp. AH-315-M07]